MPSRRCAVAVTILLSAATVFAWMAVDGLMRARPPAPLEVDVCYAVECSGDTCTLDLDFFNSARYLLIVGSMAAGPESHTVSLHAETVPAVVNQPLVRVQPLRPRKLVRDPSICRHVASESSSRLVESNGSRQSSEREFFIHVTEGDPDDPLQYARVRGKCVAEGRSVCVYLDDQQNTSELADGVIEEVVRLFDDVVLPNAQQNLGSCRDVDGDGRFTILMSPWLDRLQGGQTSLGGFVREGDFRTDLKPPFTNRCDMLCLNTNLRPDAHLLTLLTHEFAHAICFSERLPSDRNRHGLPPEDDWLGEAVAHVSENLGGASWTNLDYRVSRFLSAPEAYPLVVEDYYGTGMWRNHGCRGATYLFLRWCVDQYGDELLRRLIHSPARGTRSLEWATRESFENLYRQWTFAMYKSGRSIAAGANASAVDACPVRPVSEGEFTSLDLRGKLSSFGLAGPRTQTWHLDETTHEVAVRGTSSAFLELTANGDRGVQRVNVRGSYGSRLQVSVVPLGDDRPVIFAKAAWTDSSEPIRLANLSSTNCLTVQVAGDVASGCVIETIACERNFGETRESFCFSGETLQQFRQRQPAPDGGRGALVFSLAVPSLATQPPPGSFQVKVVSRDRQGRRATAWVTLDEPADASLRFAQAHD